MRFLILLHPLTNFKIQKYKNVQSDDKEEIKLTSTITVNSGAHTLTHD